MSHTPGPWEIHYEYDLSGYPCFFIHGFSGDQKRDEDTLCANARLIAAAPELLEALKEAKEFIENQQLPEKEWARVLDKSVAAIKKATGAA